MSPAEARSDAPVEAAELLARVPAVGLGWPLVTSVPRAGEVPGTEVGNGWPAGAVATPSPR